MYLRVCGRVQDFRKALMGMLSAGVLYICGYFGLYNDAPKDGHPFYLGDSASMSEANCLNKS